MSLSMEQLQAIAEGLNVETKHIQDQESLVYEILDAQAIQNASQQPAKKRTRIVKKDVDHVYSANQEKSESFEKKTPAKKTKAKTETSSESGTATDATPAEKPKKTRTRKNTTKETTAEKKRCLKIKKANKLLQQQSLPIMQQIQKHRLFRQKMQTPRLTP